MNIKKYRLRVGMNQEDVAKALGMDRSSVAKWETGKAFPRKESLMELARILECSVDDLIQDEESA